jgi:putative membrane protein
LAYLIWSGAHPTGRFNWLMEAFPAMVGGTILVLTYRRFRFTTSSYCLV